MMEHIEIVIFFVVVFSLGMYVGFGVAKDYYLRQIRDHYVKKK